MSAARTLRVYLDYISSNVYLAWLRLPALAERHDLEIEPVPVLFAALLEANGQLGPAEIRPKARWMARNTLRKAGLLGVPLRPPPFHPFNPLLALRASSLDLPPAQRAALVTELLRATWAEQRDVSEPEVVAGAAERAGIDDPASIPERATRPETKQRLRSQTDDAIARGVFGVPIFELEGELFWGYDDLPYLEMVLAGEDPIDPEEARFWGTGPPRPGSMRRQFRDSLPPSWARERDERESGD